MKELSLLLHKMNGGFMIWCISLRDQCLSYVAACEKPEVGGLQEESQLCVQSLHSTFPVVGGLVLLEAPTVFLGQK